jgi:phosphate-selective porin OprO and OprP
MKPMNRIFLTLLVVLLFLSTNSKSQNNNDILNLLIQRKLITQEDADSLRADDAIKQQEAADKKKSFALTASKLFQLSGYAHLRYQIDDQPGKIDGFDVRRAYLDLKGNITPYWGYRLQTDFSNSPRIIDAYIEYKLNDYLNFTVGQFLLPFSLENLTSNLKFDLIDRSQAVEALVARSKDVIGRDTAAKGNITNYNGRDIGIQVGGTLVKLNDKSFIEYKIGLFNGSGINQVDKNESKDIVTRVNVNPLNGLSFGVSYYNGVGNIGRPPANHKRERFGIDASYDYQNLSFRGEFLKGTDNKTRREGYFIQAGYYLIAQKLQVVAKYDAYDPDIDIKKNASIWYIGAINYTFNPNVRLQADYTFKDEEGTEIANNLTSIQLQVSF